MSNSASATKRHKQSLKRRARNRVVRSHVRKSVKSLEAAISEKNEEALEVRFREFVKIIDRAAGKGQYHRNTAARKKSRMAKKLAAYRAAV